MDFAKIGRYTDPYPFRKEKAVLARILHLFVEISLARLAIRRIRGKAEIWGGTRLNWTWGGLFD